MDEDKSISPKKASDEHTPMNPEQLQLFDSEFLPHLEALNTFAYHLTYDERSAEDLVQETYFKALKSIDRYKKGTNAKAWLFRILKNAFINEYRRKNKAAISSLDFDETEKYTKDINTEVTGYFDLREEIFNRKLGDEISTALNNLPIEYRSVILLCDIEGFTYDEISKILNIPTGTVRSRLFRARNVLKDQLKAYGASKGYADKRKSKKKSLQKPSLES